MEFAANNTRIHERAAGVNGGYIRKLCSLILTTTTKKKAIL